MKIVYLHGRLSSPDSRKAKRLREMGHDVVAPALPKDNWKQSVWNATAAVVAHQPDLIVGSSRGGAVAIAVNGNLPTILIAPAWRKFNPNGYISKKCHIIHSQEDDIVSFTDSLWITKLRGIPLIEAGQDHRMNSEDVYDAISSIIEGYIEEVKSE